MKRDLITSALMALGVLLVGNDPVSVPAVLPGAALIITAAAIQAAGKRRRS